MAISEKILKAPPSAVAALDPRDYFGSVPYTGTGTTQSINGGKYDACAEFNGSSSKITLADNTFTYTALTISVWVKPSGSGHRAILENYNYTGSPGSQGWLLKIDNSNNKALFRAYNGDCGTAYPADVSCSNVTQIFSDSAISTSNWTHIVLTMATGTNNLKMYINGSVQSTTTTLQALSYNATSLSSIGCLRYSGASDEQFYSGLMDHMRVYDSALSASEVTSLYNESYANSFKVNFPTGKTAKALYRFNGNADDETGVHNGTASNITWKYGVNFTPDIVWLKKRNDAKDHQIQDTSRGIGSLGGAKQLYPNGNWAESTNADTNYFRSFDSGGFTLGGNDYTNGSNQTYVAWCWKVNGGTTSSNSDGDITSTVQVNDDAGISIVLYTTNGNNAARVGHGLATKPKAVLIKNRSASGSWHFMTTAIDGSFDDLILDSTSAKSDSSLTPPNSTTFASESGAASNTRVAYCFHDVDGYQKIGTYTGNGSANGPLVETGFEPAFLMIKNTGISSAGSYWAIYDNKRTPSNPRTTILRANSNAGDFSADSLDIDFLSDGFQVKGTYDAVNDSGENFVYLAIAAPPETTTPVLADSFNIKTWTGNGTYPPDADGSDDITINTDFAPDFVWGKVRNDNISHILIDSVRGENKQIHTNSTDAQDIRDPDTKPNAYKFLSNGFSVNTWGNLNNAKDYVGYIWKASGSTEILTAGSLDSLASINDKAGFSIVKYTGNATAGATVAHGLSAAPQFIMIKNIDRNGYGWLVYHASRGATKYLVMNTNAGETAQTSIFNDTAPTSTVFTLGSDTFGNYSGDNYIAYCWRPISGFSKFGSYDGNSASDGSGTTQSITTGFQPDLVIIKRYDGTENWYMQDSARGSTKQFYANLNDDEDTETNGIQSFDSTGFTLGGYNGINNQGESFIYMAFKAN